MNFRSAVILLSEVLNFVGSTGQEAVGMRKPFQWQCLRYLWLIVKVYLRRGIQGSQWRGLYDGRTGARAPDLAINIPLMVKSLYICGFSRQNKTGNNAYSLGVRFEAW